MVCESLLGIRRSASIGPSLRPTTAGITSGAGDDDDAVAATVGTGLNANLGLGATSERTD